MSQFRLAVLLSLLAAAGCYNDAPPQSTLPEPQYVSGPPGGAMDPDVGYQPHAGEPSAGAVASAAPGALGGPAVAGDNDDDDSDEDAPAPPAAAPVEGAPGPSVAVGPEVPAPGEASEPGPAPGDEIAAAPDPAAAPTASVTDVEINTALAGYGQWIDTDDYGEVWRPDATVVGVDFTPYESGGSWLYTDAGWAFSCEYPWGWLPFHYGRWAWFHGYWGWVPGHRWGPAWVDWRNGGGVIGWRPRPPRLRDHRLDGGHRFGSGPLVRDHRHAEQHDAHWRFAAVSDFARPHIRSHLYGNAAEGLRVTSAVAAPPVRARASVRATDLMRNRFTAGGAMQPGPGRFGGLQVRDHRGDPTRAYQPPARTYQPPTRAYQPPARAYQQPVYQPPQQTYRPPASQPPQRTYQPPVRTYQPPARTYQPPVRTYQPPVRTYQPPVRTYQPHTPSSPPSHSWSPPSHSSSPPSHSSSPPSHSSSSSSSSGSHSSSSSHSSSGGGHHR